VPETGIIHKISHPAAENSFLYFLSD
ncbi:unnamed protein product, partial [Allacma fusca]